MTCCAIYSFVCTQEKHLSKEYCQSHPLIAGKTDIGDYTELWTYKDCVWAFTMRTVAQFICIFSLLAFNSTFALDLRPQLMYLNPIANTPSTTANKKTINSNSVAWHQYKHLFHNHCYVTQPFVCLLVHWLFCSFVLVHVASVVLLNRSQLKSKKHDSDCRDLISGHACRM